MWLCLGPFSLSWEVLACPFAYMLNKSESTRIDILWGWAADIVFSDTKVPGEAHATWVTRRGFTRWDESRSKSANRSLVIMPLIEVWALWGPTYMPHLRDRISTRYLWLRLANSDIPVLIFDQPERVPFEWSTAEPRGSLDFHRWVRIRGMSRGDVWCTHTRH